VLDGQAGPANPRFGDFDREPRKWIDGQERERVAAACGREFGIASQPVSKAESREDPVPIAWISEPAGIYHRIVTRDQTF
jgi:hypothetical protein